MTIINELIPINHTLPVSDLINGWSDFYIITIAINTKSDLPTWDQCELVAGDGENGLIVERYVTDNESDVCLYAIENKTLMVTIGDYMLLINLLEKDNPKLVKEYGTFSQDTMNSLCKDISSKIANVGVFNRTKILDKISYQIKYLNRITNVKYKNIIHCLKKDKMCKPYNKIVSFLAKTVCPPNIMITVDKKYNIDEKLLDCSKFLIVAIVTKDNKVSLLVHDGDKNFITPNMINGKYDYNINYVNAWILKIHDSSSMISEDNNTIIVFIKKNNEFLLKMLNAFDVAKNDDPDILDAKKLERCLTFMLPTNVTIMIGLLRHVAYPTTMLSQYVTDNQFKEILDKNSKPVSLN